MEMLRVTNIVLSSILIALLFTSNWLRRVDNDVCDSAISNKSSNRSNSLEKAIETMRSKGYKVMASFLETQLLALDEHELADRFFIYAPSDEAVARANVGFGQLPLILLRHITSSRLLGFSDGLDLWRTFLPGFIIIQTWNPYHMFNCEVPYEGTILYADYDREIYVYGLPEVLSALTEEEILTRRGGLSRPCYI